MKLFLAIGLFLSCLQAMAASVAYIHGDVSRFGDIPSGGLAPYDQMLLNDSGRTGLSQFQTLVESQGHTIAQFYDRDTSLSTSFLNNYDVVIFGLHQKLWSTSDKAALRQWLRAGGGMFIYSDSASGGCFCEVGAQNDVGQSRTNNLIAEYGMQVTVDQADGVRTVTADSPNPLMAGQPVLQGEGVSPVAVASGDSSIEVLIPYNFNIRHTQNVTVPNRRYAALALKTFEQGHIAVLFDRQPLWNNGPGSDINKQDNREILRRMINFLALRPLITDPPLPPSTPVDVFINGALMLILEEQG